jgi:hypothetical protein
VRRLHGDAPARPPPWSGLGGAHRPLATRLLRAGDLGRLSTPF